ncbi:MAG: hypothetical protein WC289_04965 [Patescibacteria group bacterium]
MIFFTLLLAEVVAFLIYREKVVREIWAASLAFLVAVYFLKDTYFGFRYRYVKPKVFGSPILRGNMALIYGWGMLIVACSLCSLGIVFLGLHETTGSTEPLSLEWLLTVQMHGGLCLDGGSGYICNTTYTLSRSGRYELSSSRHGKEIHLGQGQISITQLEKLTAAVHATNFTQLRAEKFTGTCPTAYDGQEKIFHFYQENNQRIESLATCTYMIDETQPLFVLINGEINTALVKSRE